MCDYNQNCLGNESSCPESAEGERQPVYVERVEVYPYYVELNVGEYFHSIQVDVLPPYADNTTILWASDNPSVASVDSYSGTIYASSPGTAHIYANATDGSGCNDYISVGVLDMNVASSVSLDLYELYLEEGDEGYLSAAVPRDIAIAQKPT